MVVERMGAPNPHGPVEEVATDELPARRRKWSDLFRRPLSRVLVVLAIAALVWVLATGAPPHATVAIVNDTLDPIEAIEVTIDEGEGRTRIERIEVLDVGARFEFASPARKLKVDRLSYTRGATPERLDDLGDVPAGEALTLRITPAGRLEREQAPLPQ